MDAQPEQQTATGVAVRVARRYDNDETCPVARCNTCRDNEARICMLAGSRTNAGRHYATNSTQSVFLVNTHLTTRGEVFLKGAT